MRVERCSKVDVSLIASFRSSSVVRELALFNEPKGQRRGRNRTGFLEQCDPNRDCKQGLEVIPASGELKKKN